jgi:predicted RNase H-like nuclease
MVLPDEANADEAKYWETYSAKFAEYGAQERERAARAYQKSIEQAELDEGIAAVFAKNRTVALKGERPMERVVVGELLAARRRCQYRASGPAAWSAYEDTLDTVVCAWIAVCALEGRAVPFGDESSAIWIPGRPLAL